MSSEPEPISEAAPASEPEPKSEPESTSEPEPKSEPEPTSPPEPKLTDETDSIHHCVTDKHGMQNHDHSDGDHVYFHEIIGTTHSTDEANQSKHEIEATAEPEPSSEPESKLNESASSVLEVSGAEEITQNPIFMPRDSSSESTTQHTIFVASNSELFQPTNL